ncbi:nuclear receptor ROR-alpha A-like [Danaus plexippus]|uniref:nuclear receptor ROR-alpha A-like n=1 Tax=Danaus plexippus TaxID=13037 RepID=UPI002AB1FBB8|nr:nuclear receptor ROR-alpha A-like [Danaus plexippus]
MVVGGYRYSLHYSRNNRERWMCSRRSYYGWPITSCPICGDAVNGIHYGIFTCESCKSFFRRTLQTNKQAGYVCRYKRRKRPCDMTVQTRSFCRFCRFNRCLEAGMQPDFVVPRYSWSRAGNAIIILGDYRFKKRSKHINQKQETHWVCNKCDKGCKAKLTTLNDAIIKMYNVHKHDGSRKLK